MFCKGFKITTPYPSNAEFQSIPKCFWSRRKPPSLNLQELHVPISFLVHSLAIDNGIYKTTLSKTHPTLTIYVIHTLLEDHLSRNLWLEKTMHYGIGQWPSHSQPRTNLGSSMGLLPNNRISIKIRWIPTIQIRTEYQLADLLTKALPHKQFSTLLSKVTIINQ